MRTYNPTKGTDHYCAKLTEADVREIRKRGESLSKMAARYGVSESTIAGIIKGRTWRSVV